MCTYIIIKEMFDELLTLPELRLQGTTSNPNNSLWSVYLYTWNDHDNVLSTMQPKNLFIEKSFIAEINQRNVIR